MQKRGYYVPCGVEKGIIKSFSYKYDYGSHSYMLKLSVKEVMGSHHGWNVRTEKGHGNVRSFVGFVQLLSHTNATMLRSTAIVFYPVHAILLNISARKSRWFISNGHTLISFLSVCCIEKQLEGVQT